MIPDRLFEKWERLAFEREGCSNIVYKDSLGKLTFGIGCLVFPGDNLKEGDYVEDERIDSVFLERSESVYAVSSAQAAQLGVTSQDFILALMSANYQLGNFAVKFGATFDLLKDGNWKEAIRHIERSPWMRQTPVRARDLINAITKAYAPPWWKRILTSRPVTRSLQ